MKKKVCPLTEAQHFGHCSNRLHLQDGSSREIWRLLTLRTDGLFSLLSGVAALLLRVMYNFSVSLASCFSDTHTENVAVARFSTCSAPCGISTMIDHGSAACLGSSSHGTVISNCFFWLQDGLETVRGFSAAPCRPAPREEQAFFISSQRTLSNTRWRCVCGALEKTEQNPKVTRFLLLSVARETRRKFFLFLLILQHTHWNKAVTRLTTCSGPCGITRWLTKSQLRGSFLHVSPSPFGPCGRLQGRRHEFKTVRDECIHGSFRVGHRNI